MNSNWNGTNDRSQHRGNYFVREGIEISPDACVAVVNAVSAACAMQKALSKTGQGPSFDDVKGIIASAIFGATAAEKNVTYINEQVRAQGKKHQTPHQRSVNQSSGTGGLGESDRGEFDFD